MTSYTFRSSRPDNWTQPRPFTDASMRHMAYGAIQPMSQPTLFQRLFGF